MFKNCATYELLKDDALKTFQKRGKIEAKGKGEMAMYFVVKALMKIIKLARMAFPSNKTQNFISD